MNMKVAEVRKERGEGVQIPTEAPGCRLATCDSGALLVCVCACARGRARARVCMSMCVCDCVDKRVVLLKCTEDQFGVKLFTPLSSTLLWN